MNREGHEDDIFRLVFRDRRVPAGNGRDGRMIWRNIPGFGGKYQVSVDGRVRRTYKSREPKELSRFTRKGKQTLWVKLSLDRKSRERKVAHLVWLAFRGPIPEGMAVRHKNGDLQDDGVNNLELIDRKRLGELTGAKSRRRPVVKKEPWGQTVEAYRSAREAARRNFMSYQTVIDLCNGKVKRGKAPDGFIYQWDD